MNNNVKMTSTAAKKPRATPDEVRRSLATMYESPDFCCTFREALEGRGMTVELPAVEVEGDGRAVKTIDALVARLFPEHPDRT